MNRRERWVVFLIGSCHMMVHCYEQIFPALLLTIVAYFRIDIAIAGWMQTALAMAFGLGGLPAGYIADRIGSKRVIMLYLVGAGLSCIFIATTHSALSFAAGLAAMGLFISLYHPAGATLITTQVKQVGEALGYHGVGGGLGLAIAPVLATLLAAADPRHGWRLSFVVFGLFGLVLAASVKTLKVSEIRLSNPGVKFRPARVAKGPATPLVIFLLVAVTVGFCYRGVTTYLPAYFSQRLNGGIFGTHSVLKGGAFATMTLFVGVVGQFLGGQLAGRYRLEKLFAILMMLSVPFLLMMSVLSNLPLLFIAMAFALFYFSSQPVGNALIAEYTDPRGRGLGYGVYFAASFGVGSLASGFCGMIAKRFGLNEVFLVLAITIFVGFLVMLYLVKASSSRANARLDAETERVL
jgi:MFS family permease